MLGLFFFGRFLHAIIGERNFFIVYFGGGILGGLFFLVQHESYHIGQMAILRKGLGYNAMSYERLE
jgi:membrane associated rhomboid family serine protease